MTLSVRSGKCRKVRSTTRQRVSGSGPAGEPGAADVRSTCGVGGELGLGAGELGFEAATVPSAEGAAGVSQSKEPTGASDDVLDDAAIGRIEGARGNDACGNTEICPEAVPGVVVRVWPQRADLDDQLDIDAPLQERRAELSRYAEAARLSIVTRFTRSAPLRIRSREFCGAGTLPFGIPLGITVTGEVFCAGLSSTL